MSAVKYRSIDGGLFDAVLLVAEGDHVTVDVKVPGCSAPFRRTRIPYLAVDNGVSRGVCFVGEVPPAVNAAVPSRRARRMARAAARG